MLGWQPSSSSLVGEIRGCVLLTSPVHMRGEVLMGLQKGERVVGKPGSPPESEGGSG